MLGQHPPAGQISQGRPGPGPGKPRKQQVDIRQAEQGPGCVRALRNRAALRTTYVPDGPHGGILSVKGQSPASEVGNDQEPGRAPVWRAQGS